MSVYPRGNIWWIKFQRNNKPYYFSSESTDKRVALKLEKQIKRDFVLGKLDKTRTLDEVALEWATTIAPRQKDSRNSLLNLRHIADFIDGVPVTQAPMAANKIRAAFSHLTPATVNRRLALLRRFCNLAHEWGWIDSPPKIKLIEGEKPRNVYLTKQQVVKLAKASGESRWHILVLAFTGMRIGELLRAKRVENILYLDDTKGGKPRAVPMNRPAQVFYDRLKQGRVYHTIQRDFKQATTLCEMPGVRPHDLRHTNASWLVKKGVNLATIRDILGHSNLSVTSRYTHLAVEQMQEALDRI